MGTNSKPVIHITIILAGVMSGKSIIHSIYLTCLTHTDIGVDKE